MPPRVSGSVGRRDSVVTFDTNTRTFGFGSSKIFCSTFLFFGTLHTKSLTTIHPLGCYNDQEAQASRIAKRAEEKHGTSDQVHESPSLT